MDSAPEPKPTIDRSTLLPILLGVFSLFGILLVFVIGRMNSDRNALPPEDTATPFKYQLIGTEPGISTAEFLTAEPGSAEDPSEGSPGSPGLMVTAGQGSSSGSGSSSNTSTSPTKTKTSSSVILTAAGNATDPVIILNPGTKSATPGLVVIERTHTPSRTPGPTITVTSSRTKSVTSTTSASTSATQVPLTPGTYDDSHPLIGYDGWNGVTEASAYQSTLHVSNIAGSTVTFRFTGQQFRLTFQGSASFGTIRINIGGLNFDLDQSNGTNEWVSTLLTQGTYIVTITHTGGGSVNIDSVIIPDFNTPTPSLTPTATSNGQ